MTDAYQVNSDQSSTDQNNNDQSNNDQSNNDQSNNDQSSTVTLQQLLENRDVSSTLARERLAQQLAAITDLNAVLDIAFAQLRLDSRQVSENDAFILLKSQTPNCQQSRRYLQQAAKSAAFILSELDPEALLSEANAPADANI